MSEKKDETKKQTSPEDIKLEDKVENDSNKKSDLDSDKKKSQDSNEKKDSVSNSEYIKLKYQFSEFVNKFKDYEKEFENYKKRTREELKQAKLDGIKKAVETLLPALDSFKKARNLITDKSSISGINLIEKSILSELDKLGVKRIKCVGEPFNTDFHNAVALVEDKNKKPGIVVEEIEAGYTMDEKVIKFCQVVVSK